MRLLNIKKREVSCISMVSFGAVILREINYNLSHIIHNDN